MEGLDKWNDFRARRKVAWEAFSEVVYKQKRAQRMMLKVWFSVFMHKIKDKFLELKDRKHKVKIANWCVF